MKCRKARKLLSLHREGELSQFTKEKLLHHTVRCESCKKLYAEYFESEAVMDRMRFIEFHPEDKESLTNRILNKIETMQAKRKMNVFSGIMDAMTDLVSKTLIRYSVIACILLVIMGFGFQQIYIFYNISKLEDQLALASEKTMYSMDQEIPDCIQKSARLLSRISIRNMEIKKSIRDEILNNPEKLNKYATLLCRYDYQRLLISIDKENFLNTRLPI